MGWVPAQRACSSSSRQHCSRAGSRPPRPHAAARAHRPPRGTHLRSCTPLPAKPFALAAASRAGRRARARTQPSTRAIARLWWCAAGSSDACRLCLPAGGGHARVSPALCALHLAGGAGDDLRGDAVAAADRRAAQAQQGGGHQGEERLSAPPADAGERVGGGRAAACAGAGARRRRCACKHARPFPPSPPRSP